MKVQIELENILHAIMKLFSYKPLLQQLSGFRN